MSDIKKLMGDAISADTAEALQTILDEAIQKSETKVKDLEDLLSEAKAKLDEVTAELQDTKAELSEANEAHSQEVKFISEKAEEYAEQVKQETIQEMTEKAEAYGQFLTEKAEEYGQYLIGKGEEYGDHLIEQAEKYGEFLTEKAEEYGAHLIEQAESYGEFLIEKAEGYAASKEEKCLQEAEKQINEFKSEHREMFERIDEHQRMSNVFASLKTLVETSGFSLDESEAFERNRKELSEERLKARRAARELREAKEQLRAYKISEAVEKVAGDRLTFKDKESLIESVSQTRWDNEEELSKIATTLVEGVINKKSGFRTTSSNYATNTLTENKVISKGTSGWGDRLK